MSYTVITIDDSELGEKPVTDVFNKKLQSSLLSGFSRFALILRPEQKPDVDTFDWIEQWALRYAKAGKEFVVVPVTPGQMEILELIHPDQNIKYVLSLDDLGEILPRELQAPPDRAALADDAGESDNDGENVFEVMLDRNTPGRGDEEVPYVGADRKENLEITVGAVADVSGEYTCLGCNATRMWIKGEAIARCENPECLNPTAGWQLSCDIF